MKFRICATRKVRDHYLVEADSEEKAIELVMKEDDSIELIDEKILNDDLSDVEVMESWP